jgi:8-oxo-dGTP pyrophosphatase MutT (NUDIX family)
MEKRILALQRIQPAMYCNNCGGKGHIFKFCNDPVLSCGIILLDNSELPAKPDSKLLMIRRKDSMSFAEFMRGRYEPNDLEYIGRLMSNMTLKEQSAIACEPFDTLWKSLWGDDHNSPDYIASRDKFAQLDRVELMRNNLSIYTEPEWGFPKGRRIRGESDVDCAIREFGEETNIPREAYVVLRNLRFEETFAGLNGIQYRHVYFVALLKEPEMVNLAQRFTPMQRREISGIDWKTFDECSNLIRPHHTQRAEMLTHFNSVVTTFETV